MVAGEGFRWVSITITPFTSKALIGYANSIDAQWIVAKKDWKEAKKKYKEQEKYKDAKKPEAVDLGDLEPGTYQQDMDEMRCILYAHGGMFNLVDILHVSKSYLGDRWILFWKCRSGEILYTAPCEKDQWTCVW